ncbi:MAG TPA: DUF4160 domain-containing protein, partial [Candidatus Lustribacter sp.]|nr:DUF4160 domain-containing protein [Candidatus Lustribacter sp.]
WRLVVSPRDHEPRHVHARQGTGRAPEAIIQLNIDGSTSVRVVERGISRADRRQIVAIVDEHFAELVEIWERVC